MKIAYIDSQNVHKGIEELGWLIDWRLFYKYLKTKFNVDKIKIFFGYVKRYEKLYQYLKEIGYEVVYKETLILPNGDIKGNVDIDIAIHTMLDTFEGGLGKVYLVTGDGDYNTLVYLLKSRNLLGRVLVPNKKKASKLLKKSAGADIQTLEDIKFLIQKRKV